MAPALSARLELTERAAGRLQKPVPRPPPAPAPHAGHRARGASGRLCPQRPGSSGERNV